MKSRAAIHGDWSTKKVHYDVCIVPQAASNSIELFRHSFKHRHCTTASVHHEHNFSTLTIQRKGIYWKAKGEV